jgi:D-alanyl-D-alanine carboxypeptidase/D-alanyl-D-alanine-endopeptidase (penicillin-binding protein 4)
LQGDLIVIGGGDPLFVWEEAITLGNALNELGITEVTGNLIIVGNFQMNFQGNPAIAGNSFKQALNAQTWTREIATQHGKMKPGTPRPQVKIAGVVKSQDDSPANLNPLVDHTSLNLAQILKSMNLYSNNPLAESLAEEVGGAKQVAKLAADAANVPPAEIRLVNGSGLGTANRISPRAVIAMLQTIERKLKSQPIGITDLFPVAGRDAKGTMLERNIPLGAAVKTGTLREVSALAGVLPTRDRGQVWFAIINGGSWDIRQFRDRQDALLQQLTQVWGVGTPPPTPRDQGYLGDPARNEITYAPEG